MSLSTLQGLHPLTYPELIEKIAHLEATEQVNNLQIDYLFETIKLLEQRNRQLKNALKGASIMETVHHAKNDTDFITRTFGE